MRLGVAGRLDDATQASRGNAEEVVALRREAERGGDTLRFRRRPFDARRHREARHELAHR